jgi:hypothetical protein
MPIRVLVLTDQSKPRPTCTVHFFGCARHAARDFENRLRAAVFEWLASQEGQCVRVQIGDERFDWGHAIDGVPPAVWRKYGLALRSSFFDEAQTFMLEYQPVPPVPQKRGAQ